MSNSLLKYVYKFNKDNLSSFELLSKLIVIVRYLKLIFKWFNK